jgi:hypothetical protein
MMMTMMTMNDDDDFDIAVTIKIINEILDRLLFLFPLACHYYYSYYYYFFFTAVTVLYGIGHIRYIQTNR